MPSQLVIDVRQRIANEGRPLAAVERALLLATLMPPRHGGEDALDELEAAICDLRRDLPTIYATTVVPPQVRRLIRAARNVLDYVPPDPDYDPARKAPALAHGGRPERADVDG